MDQRAFFSSLGYTAAGVVLGFTLKSVLDSLQAQPPATPISIGTIGHAEVAKLLKAAKFSAEKHRDQRRKNASEEPYIIHPIRVACKLANEGDVDDVDVLIAALLHDTVEDTETSLDEIASIFGGDVAKIVDEVSDDKTLAKEKRKQLQIEHAPHASRGAKLVKLADKLDNLSDLQVQVPVGWGAERVGSYFDWAAKVIAGLRGTNASLESNLDEILSGRNIAMEKAREGVP